MSVAQYVAGYISGGEDEAEERVKETSLGYALAGGRSADVAEEQSERVARAQQDALAYLQSIEEVPQRYRSAATEQLGFLFGLGTPEEQEAAYAQLEASPVYRQAQETALQGLQAGQEAILRGASATGGLRSGGTSAALADLSAQLTQAGRQAGFQQYLSGLGGLGQLQTDPQGIARAITSPAETLASGALAGAQAQQQGAGTLANLGLSALSAFSDPHLKTNIVKVGELPNGLGWYSWKWSKEAEDLGMHGDGIGVMADEVKVKYPNLVSEINGYKIVDYGGILNGC